MLNLKKYFIIIFFSVISSLLVIGCGLKGSLYIPNETTVSEKQEPEDNMNKDNVSANNQQQKNNN